MIPPVDEEHPIELRRKGERMIMAIVNGEGRHELEAADQVMIGAIARALTDLATCMTRRQPRALQAPGMAWLREASASATSPRI
jgi:hypothetical protein